MKFTNSLVIGVLFGLVSFDDVQAIKLQESEASELMASIDLDLEQLHKKHAKHHKKAKKHHRRSHQKVQTQDEDAKEEKDSTPVVTATIKKEEPKKEEEPKNAKADREEEVTNRAEKKVSNFKDIATIKKNNADDATERLEKARNNANETFDDLKAEKKTDEKVKEAVKKASEGSEKNAEKAEIDETKPLDKPDNESVKKE